MGGGLEGVGEGQEGRGGRHRGIFGGSRDGGPFITTKELKKSSADN